MKQKPNRPMDEREKLRKFRELDDAFAEALRELEDPDARSEIPTGPPVRSLDELEREERASAAPSTPQQGFEEHLRALMREYAQPEESVADLLRTLQALGHIA